MSLTNDNYFMMHIIFALEETCISVQEVKFARLAFTNMQIIQIYFHFVSISLFNEYCMYFIVLIFMFLSLVTLAIWCIHLDQHSAWMNDK